MPVTPFHFGIAAAVHSAAPARISFLSFCAANVLIDVEPLYYMLNDEMPLHRFFHTFAGATLLAAATCVLFMAFLRWGRWLPDVFGWQGLSLSSVAAGAVTGVYTHLLLDAVMHADVYPFAPFSSANPLLGLLSIPALHAICLGAGALGVAVLMARKRLG